MPATKDSVAELWLRRLHTASWEMQYKVPWALSHDPYSSFKDCKYCQRQVKRFKTLPPTCGNGGAE